MHYCRNIAPSSDDQRSPLVNGRPLSYNQSLMSSPPPPPPPPPDLTGSIPVSTTYNVFYKYSINNILANTQDIAVLLDLDLYPPNVCSVHRHVISLVRLFDFHPNYKSRKFFKIVCIELFDCSLLPSSCLIPSF